MATSRTFIIATRGSALALAQAYAFQKLCRNRFPQHLFELRIFKTTGDKLQTAALADSKLPKGLFTKELEVALLERQADLAVHSLKDLPTELPEGLALGSVGEREDVRDVLVGRAGDWSLPLPQPGSALTLKDILASIAAGDVIATSSTRRAAQLREMAPQVQISTIRGNVGTRLKKAAEDQTLKGTLLAAAGLHRLGLEIGQDGILQAKPGATESVPPGLRAVYLPAEEFLPCVGQAAVGIEVRSQDPEIQALCQALNHRTTWDAVTAERAFLNELGGGCQAAVAAYATVTGETVKIRAVSYLGKQPERAELSGLTKDADALGRQLAHAVLASHP